MSIETRLAELGITLPEPAAPVAAYVPVVIAGGLAHVSGQVSFVDGVLVKGRLGEDVSLEAGVEAAQGCGLMILAQLKAALGSLDRVERVVKTYSAHVPVPIRFAKAGEAASRELTDGSALWAKAKSEVTKEEYAEFYGNVSGQWDEPALTIHYRAEGRTEYSVLLFVALGALPPGWLLYRRQDSGG